ncbi:MAG: DUF3426 domain-containing protein, partial [Brachymonas sp.]|nr:DUF3426 domain-containing protein [Brachymonas sp.]
MRFVTHCPTCGTSFKVVPDQLRIAQGWVRCGQCQTVYKADDKLELEEQVLGAATPLADKQSEVANSNQTSQASQNADAGSTRPISTATQLALERIAAVVAARKAQATQWMDESELIADTQLFEDTDSEPALLAPEPAQTTHLPPPDVPAIEAQTSTEAEKPVSQPEPEPEAPQQQAQTFTSNYFASLPVEWQTPALPANAPLLAELNLEAASPPAELAAEAALKEPAPEAVMQQAVADVVAAPALAQEVQESHQQSQLEHWAYEPDLQEQDIMLQAALLEQAAMLTENQAENQALSQAENAITTQTDRPELQEADVIDSAQLAAALQAYEAQVAAQHVAAPDAQFNAMAQDDFARMQEQEAVFFTDEQLSPATLIWLDEPDAANGIDAGKELAEVVFGETVAPEPEPEPEPEPAAASALEDAAATQGMTEAQLRKQARRKERLAQRKLAALAKELEALQQAEALKQAETEPLEQDAPEVKTQLTQSEQDKSSQAPLVAGDSVQIKQAKTKQVESKQAESKQVESNPLEPQPIGAPHSHAKPEPSAAQETTASAGAADSQQPESAQRGLVVQTPVADLSFVRAARRRVFWAQPKVRMALAFTAALASLMLALQVLLHYRSPLYAQIPLARMGLDVLCRKPWCSIPPWQNIEAVTIESSNFRKLSQDVYRFNVALRNASTHPVAMPALELNLLNDDGQIIVRRIIANDAAMPAPP